MSIYFLPVKCNKGQFFASIHYVQSIGHNIVKQGLFLLPQEV